MLRTGNSLCSLSVICRDYYSKRLHSWLSGWAFHPLGNNWNFMLREKPEEWQEFSGVAVVARLFLQFVPGWASCDLSKEGVSPRNKRMKWGPGSSAWKCWDVGLPDVRFAIQAPLSCLCRWGGGTQTLEPGSRPAWPLLGLTGMEGGVQYTFVPKAENTGASSQSICQKPE